MKHPDIKADVDSPTTPSSGVVHHDNIQPLTHDDWVVQSTVRRFAARAQEQLWSIYSIDLCIC